MKGSITLLITLTSITLFSQNNLVGIKGGLNLTNIKTTEYLSATEESTGFSGGITYERTFKEKLSFGVDLLYFQKGYDWTLTFTNEFRDANGNTGKKSVAEFDYDYLSLPIKGGVVLGNKVSAFANIGLVPSILLSVNVYTTEGTTVTGEENSSKFDLGGLVELGASINLNAKSIVFFSFGYQQSFTSISNKNYFPNADVKFYGAIAALGYKYQLVRK